MRSSVLLALSLLVSTGMASAPAVGAPLRSIPRPAASHPGNVFLEGEAVSIAVPGTEGAAWTVKDYEDKTVASLPAAGGRLAAGRLPVGFYRCVPAGGGDWVSAAVLARLKAPTPASSPICVDAAMAWFYEPNRMADVAGLCALAGVNRVRDRLAWGAMEPQRGRFDGHNKYDDSATAQAAAGLRVLQVNHSSPGWANPDGRRFPLDLRDAYRFYSAMARRWRGKVAAFEPWNEADIQGFGGHTGSEMASLQKASYLGLKAGNPGVTGCLNVWAMHSKSQLADLADNQAWPYFDTYDLHHYEPLEGYPALYADHRAVSAGRPLWVSECAMPVRWSGDPERKELGDVELREQSIRLVKTFAGSLHEGSSATYYFVFPHYVEGFTQFGIVRRDLTPRPAYVALAAAGRLLADARAVGRSAGPSGLHAYAFRARPDGREAIVLVAWSGEAALNWQLPVIPLALYDHLGRKSAASRDLSLTSSPIYAVLPLSAIDALRLTPPPPGAAHLAGTPSPIVLQALQAEADVSLPQSAHRIRANEPTVVPVYAYNFTSSPARGNLKLAAPAGWTAGLDQSVTIPPMGRVELKVTLHPNGGGKNRIEKIGVTGDFGKLGRPVLSFRLLLEGSSLADAQGIELPSARASGGWSNMISSGSMQVMDVEGGVEVSGVLGEGDPWIYPVLKLGSADMPPAGAAGLACTVTLLEGEGQCRIIYDEISGASYVADVTPAPERGKAVRLVGLFDNTIYGAGWSKPDPNGQLDPGQLATLKIGGNFKAGPIRYRISNIRWVK